MPRYNRKLTIPRTEIGAAASAAFARLSRSFGRVLAARKRWRGGRPPVCDRLPIDKSRFVELFQADCRKSGSSQLRV